MAKIQAYSVNTGKKLWIPEHWLTHPVLGGSFRKTPSQKVKEKQAEAESSATTKKEK